MSLPRAKILCAALLVVLALGSLTTGVMALSSEILAISRLPRTFAAILAGGSLAVSGVILQALVRNRFVEPMTTGTGEGAALGVLLAIVLIPGAGLLAKMAFAATTALISSFGFLALVRRLPPTQPLLVPLVGIIYGGIIGAGVTFFAFQYDLLQYLGVWLSGGFSGVLQGRYELLWLAGAVAAGTYLIADQFAILSLGEDISTGLGLSYRRLMGLGLLSVTLVAALTVVTVGMIPFVGLVVPNLISLRYGDNLRATLPLAALLGAASVLAADILGRLIRFPYEIPVGVVFGVLGAGVFLWLLHRPIRHG